MTTMRRLAARALIVALTAPIHLYRWSLAALLGPRCRFEPSCSRYAIDAIELHGAARGAALALRRIARCHPWGGFGFDPVPPRGDALRF